MKARNWMNKRKKGGGVRGRLQKMMKCIFSGEQLRKVDETTVHSSESLATRDYSASGGFSSRTGDVEPKVDNSNIEEAESSLRESGYLNYEEARALLGRLEYQKGNVQAALHVYEGIDIAAAIPKIRASISGRYENNYRRHSQNDVAPLMSMHAVSLLLEAIFLKAKSLECLGRFSEAAKSCKIILDTVESALPGGLPENFTADCKLQETLNKVVELLPELWKLAGDFQEAILSYRRGMLYQWNLDAETKAKIEKEFAIFLLYSGVEASPPNLRFQMDGSFVPRNNIEECILLFLILLRKFAVGRIEWDPSILDHLSFALTISGSLMALAHVFEELPPRMLERKELYCMLALCYYGEGESMSALNILKNLLNIRDIPECILELLLASKICGEKMSCVDEGINFVHKAIEQLHDRCRQRVGLANCLLGILLSAKSRSVSSDQDRAMYMSRALESLETADRMRRIDRDPYIVYQLAVENAEQRKLDSALDYAKQVLKLEAGSSVKSYVLLARILSGQKRYSDAEIVIDDALEETGKWEQGELWRSKAKLQIARGEVKSGIETYGQLLGILQVQNKNKKLRMMHKEGGHGSLEMETWNDLAVVYTGLSQWRDAEFCLSKSKAAAPLSASTLYSTGLLYKAKGMYEEALREFEKALTLEPNHVPSLVSTASVLRRVGGCRSLPVVRSLLMDALRLDRTNHTAWYNLGLLFKAGEEEEENGRKASTAREAAECFQAAAFLEESAPIQPFR